MCIYKVSFVLTGFLSFLYSSFADADTRDLDDIKLYDIVKVEQCLDQAYDTIPGHARKLEFKVEGDDPIYEFDIESSNDGSIIQPLINSTSASTSEVIFLTTSSTSKSVGFFAVILISKPFALFNE